MKSYKQCWPDPDNHHTPNFQAAELRRRLLVFNQLQVNYCCTSVQVPASHELLRRTHGSQATGGPPAGDTDLRLSTAPNRSHDSAPSFFSVGS